VTAALSELVMPVVISADLCVAIILQTTWDIRMPEEYNAEALWEIHFSLKITGNPREIDPNATRDKCDSARCSAGFKGLAAELPQVLGNTESF
jgi:hypothetical protein